MSKMFNMVTKTWNPVTRYLHNCTYCWARRLAETRLKHVEGYKSGFIPRLNKEEFKKKFNGGIVFVCDMGDLFGDFIPDRWIKAVIHHVEKFPKTTFLFLTKNPSRYHDFDFPSNVILGATIETDRDDIYTVSDAPKPSKRIRAMTKLDHRKLLSIEPIMDFSSTFVESIKKIDPMVVYVGYDNYGNNLLEPNRDKTIDLIERLVDGGFLVVKKTIR